MSRTSSLSKGRNEERRAATLQKDHKHVRDGMVFLSSGCSHNLSHKAGVTTTAQQVPIKGAMRDAKKLVVVRQFVRHLLPRQSARREERIAQRIHTRRDVNDLSRKIRHPRRRARDQAKPARPRHFRSLSHPRHPQDIYEERRDLGGVAIAWANGIKASCPR